MNYNLKIVTFLHPLKALVKLILVILPHDLWFTGFARKAEISKFSYF